MRVRGGTKIPPATRSPSVPEKVRTVVTTSGITRNRAKPPPQANASTRHPIRISRQNRIIGSDTRIVSSILPFDSPREEANPVLVNVKYIAGDPERLVRNRVALAS